MPMLRKYRWLLILVVAASYQAMAGPGDRLLVNVKIANLRAGPATSFPVLLKLEQDRPLYEVRRKDDWVEVATGRDDIKSGWVHASLLDKDAADDESAALTPDDTTDPLFELFKLAFREWSVKLTKDTGETLFIDASNPGNRVIQLTVTGAWSNLPRARQEHILSEIFALWDAAVGDGVSITVDLIDTEGTRLMSMFR